MQPDFLHVAVLFEFPTLNGGERSMLALLDRLRGSSEFRFTAIAPGHGPLFEQLCQLGIPVVPFCVRDHGRKRAASELHAELLSIAAGLKPHILHSNSLSMCRLAGQLNIQSSLRMKRMGHLRDIIRLNQTVIRDLNQNDALIAVSRATCEHHIQQGLKRERCHVIYNGVDTREFQPRDKLAARRKVLPGLSETDVVLLNVGQICLRKGQRDVARATCDVLTQFENVHLVIVGERHSQKAESIAFEASIREEFAARDKQTRLHLPGYRSDVAEFMNAADLLVHAALQEPFGRTLLEAAASGLPVIATDVGGTAEMLQHGRDAVLVPSAEPQSLAWAITELLHVPERARQLAASARDRIPSQFTVQKMADQTVAAWRSVTDSWI